VTSPLSAPASLPRHRLKKDIPVHRVARNKIVDALRHNAIGRRVLAEWAVTRPRHDEGLDVLFLESEIEDSQLRMIFACCHPRLARENQLALTLKALFGFGTPEIARALLVGEETVKKRLQRATRDLVAHRISLDPPETGQLAGRLDSVHQVLYLLFNEGYGSRLSASRSPIRSDAGNSSAWSRTCGAPSGRCRNRRPDLQGESPRGKNPAEIVWFGSPRPSER